MAFRVALWRCALWLLLVASCQAAPVHGYVGPDPPPTTPVPACSNPSAILQVGSFSKPNQQLIAEALGFINGPFAQYSSSYCQVTGSSQQFYSLANGPYDAIVTTFDNVLNRQLNGVGEFSVLAALDNNPGQLILATNGISSIPQLRGRNIITDSSTSGFVLQFEGVTSAFGLYPSRGDYQLVAEGGGGIRYAALRAGYVTVNGTNITADAAVLGPPQSILYLTDPSNAPITRLAAISDYLAPIIGTVVAAPPALFANVTKVAALRDYLKGLIKGQAVLAAPQNAAFVTAVIGAGNKFTPAQAATAYQQLLDPVAGTVTTVPINLTLSTLAALNVAYLRERFGGFTNAYQNLTAVLQPGPGTFIDYTLRDQAYAAYLADVAISVQLPASVKHQCYYPALGQPFEVKGAAAAIAAGVSGGCTRSSTVSFVSCVASDSVASPSQCQYDAAKDELKVIAATQGPSFSRVYTVTYTVADICNDALTVTQKLTIQAPTNLDTANCQSMA